MMKKAFSLTELMMIIIVLGIIAALFVKMVRIDNITTKYTTYGAWQNLYNIIDELQNEDRAAASKVLPTSEDFCKSSAKIVSTLDEGVMCDVSSVPSTPNYTFSNGMQLFGLQGGVAAADTASTDLVQVSTRGDNPNSYRIVYIDLNGASDPDMVDNRLTNVIVGNADNIVAEAESVGKQKRGSLPDIIAFRLYNDYPTNKHLSVVPLGIAANDRRYLSARVRVINTNTGEVNFAQGVYTYQGAECAAYGASRSLAQRNQSGQNNGGIPGAVACAGKIADCTTAGHTCQIVVVRPAGVF